MKKQNEEQKQNQKQIADAERTLKMKVQTGLRGGRHSNKEWME